VDLDGVAADLEKVGSSHLITRVKSSLAQSAPASTPSATSAAPGGVAAAGGGAARI
jgi:hypothetical protein